jgi:hypothetical protein
MKFKAFCKCCTAPTTTVEAMTDFTGRFGLKNYKLGTFTKWGLKEKQTADRVDNKIVNKREET